MQRYTDEELPMFVIMMDDDTWVNVSNIIKTLLDRHNPNVPMYGGNLKNGILMGGAGHVLSHGLLKNLREGELLTPLCSVSSTTAFFFSLE
jgi:hypothetical protein